MQHPKISAAFAFRPGSFPVPILNLPARALVAFAAMTIAACGASGGSKASAQTTTTHPRVMITPAIVEELRGRMGDPDIAAIIARADRLAMNGLESGYQGNEYSNGAPIVGLAYLITRDPKYAKPLLDMLDLLNTAAAAGDVSAVAVDSTYGTRSVAFAVGIAFDWAYPELGDSRRAATVNTVNAYWNHFLTSDRVGNRDGPAYGNYFVGHVIGFGSSGYATDGDNPRAGEIIAGIRDRVAANVPAAFESGASKGGMPVEGYVYGANSFQRLFQYYLMVETATGQATPAAKQWADEIVITLLHALKPNRWQLSDEGEYTGDAAGFLEVNQVQTFAAVAGNPDAKAYGRWLLDNHGRPAMADFFVSLAPLTKLLFPVTVSGVDYRTKLPTYRHASGAALMFMRSSWDDRAVWASFNAGIKRWTDHVGRQTGHFTIQRGDDYLLVNGHQWKQSKVTSGSVTTGYQGPGYVGNTFVYPSSEWNNVLYVDDGPGGYLYDDDYYRGGQLGFNENVPYLVSQRMDATYVKSDATNAYLDNRRLSGFADRAVLLCLRNFVFFTPGNFVVFDRVRLKDAAYKYDLRFYFNSNSPPVITDGIASSTIGASRLFMRTILPQDARLTTAWQQLSGANFVPRVEVRPAAATTTFDALTVFTAAPSDFPAMPDARVIRTESESMVGAHILEPQLERVALFASADTGQVSGDIAYSLASQRARHYLFDLMPATSYTVTASATGDGARVAVAPGAGGITTDAAGVLAFDLEGTTVTPIPDDPAPPSTEQPRTPPPPRPASSASLDGGCGCSAGPTGDAAARTPLGAFAAGVVAAAMLWRLRRRTRQRSGGEREPARVLPGA